MGFFLMQARKGAEEILLCQNNDGKKMLSKWIDEMKRPNE